MAMNRKRRGTCEGCGLIVGNSFSCERRTWTADNGRRIPPITWGNETGQWEGAVTEYVNCPECGVYPGAFHHLGCSIEQIPDGIEGPPPEPAPEPEQPGLMPRQLVTATDLLYTGGYAFAWLASSPKRAIFLALITLVIAASICR